MFNIYIERIRETLIQILIEFLLLLLFNLLID